MSLKGYGLWGRKLYKPKTMDWDGLRRIPARKVPLRNAKEWVLARAVVYCADGETPRAALERAVAELPEGVVLPPSEVDTIEPHVRQKARHFGFRPGSLVSARRQLEDARQEALL